MQARKIMQLEVVAVPPELPIELAHQLMRKLAVRHLPVVSGGRLAGILSDRDLLLVIGQREGEFVYPQLPVGQVMSLAPVSATPDVPVKDLAAKMLEAKIDSLPIVSEHDELLGLVTTSDLLRVLAEFAGETPALSFHIRRADDLKARA